jgi:hypothetical protein
VRIPYRKLPPKVDLPVQKIPVQDQGELGSAAAHAAAFTFEYQKLYGIDIKYPFIYYHVRPLVNTNTDKTP